jgi:hypothetical protein
MTLFDRRLLGKCVLALAVSTTFASLAPAQTPGTIRSITFYKIKSEKFADWSAARREYIDLLKKAGSTRYHTQWTSLTGDAELAIVSYHQKFAEFDEPDPALKAVEADYARLVARFQACVESRTRVIDVIQPDLSVPAGPQIPNVVSVLRTVVKPEKINDYIALVKSELLPAVKKAGLKEFSVARSRYGQPNSQFSTVTGIPNWAWLDSPSPITTAMGDEAYQRFLAKLRPMIDSSQYDVYRYQPGQSYAPPTQ